MLKRYHLLFGLPMVLCAMGTTSSGASEQPTMMNEVVVSASRFEEKKREVSSNITIVSAEEIAQSPSTNLAELLTEKGLGHVQKYPGALSSIGIRGFRTDTHGNDLQGHVLILLDGRRAGTGNAIKLLTQNIERVEIIRGPGSLQYGSAGMGGVVNVITKRGTANSAFVEAGAGSFDRFEGSIGGTAKQEGFDFSGAVTALTYDDYETGDGVDFENSGVDREIGVSANAGISFNEYHRIGLIFTGYDVNEAGSPGYISRNDLDDYNDKSNYSFDAQYSGTTGNSTYRWMARFFVGKDENTWVDPVASNPDWWDDGIDSTNETDQLGAQIQASADYGMYSITAGFDWIDYDVDNSWSPQETSYTNPALFLLGKMRLFNEKLITTAGLRYDWYEVEVSEPAGRDEDDNNIVPQIGLAWLALDNLKLRLQYAQGFMIPSANQLAIDTTSWGRRVVGNPDLDPEKSETYEGGVDFFYNSLKGSLTYFYTDFEDKIIATYLSDGSQSWTNLGDASISGFEAELGYDIGEPLGIDWEIRPYLSGTYLTEYEDDETGEDLLYVSDLSLSAGLVVNNHKGIFTRFNVAHYSDQEVIDWESGIYPAPVVTLDSYTVADLTVSYRFYESEKYGAFSVRGDIENIFDEDYAFVKGYPMPGRSFFVTLRWDY